MRLTLATKFSAATVGVIALAVASSVVALLSSWHIASLLHYTVTENLPSVRAAEELEISLLEQRGFVSLYLLDGGKPSWLDELKRRKRSFDEWLARAQKSAHTPEEKEILISLDAVYREYDARRNAVVALYDRGDAEEAKAVLLLEVNGLYDRAYGLCEDFLAANQRYVESTTAHARRRTRQVTWAVGICVGLTIGLGAALLWLFFEGVLFPLRRMVADARVFAGENPTSSLEIPIDELRAVGLYLRTLMSDVADTRSILEDSRSRLISAEKLATVGKLAASVAHEMRNPLTAVKMWLFSIRKSIGADAELDRKFEIMSEEITRLESIIRNFLEFSRPPALKRQPKQISLLIDKTLELFGHRLGEEKIRVVRKDANDLPEVMVDPEQFKQVLINLLDNAAEATREGGEIRVSTNAASDAEGRPMVVVRIRDTGSGMPPDARQRVFEPFFTTKEEGTGLGLCIAAQIMARHQGRLVLESSSDRGTTFAVWIPTHRAQQHEPNPDR
jgi:signal transduction histidine kinase